MNALYTHALRQTQSITSDLALLESTLTRPGEASTSAAGPSTSSGSPYGFAGRGSPSLQGNGVDAAGLNGQIVASLAALQRTLEDYEDMARRELVEANKGKAKTRVERIRNDYSELKRQYDKIKSMQTTQKHEAERAALFSTGVSAGSSGTAMQQRRTVPQSPSLGGNESPFSYSQRDSGPYARAGGSSGNKASTRNLYTPRTNAALEENSFINDTGNQLDAFIAQGQAILGNLGDQRDILKSTQRRLLSAANTMGLSRNTINFIERRGRGDMAVFIAGSIFTLVSFIFIIRHFG